MNIVARTERLILRELMISDAEDFYALNANPRVIKYTGDKAFESLLDAKSFLSSYADYKINGYGRWAVVSKETDIFLGWCGLKLNEENIIDLGFRFYEDEWGNGYATESAKASISYGFDKLGIETIIGRVAHGNKRSIRVLEKIGMEFWKECTFSGLGNSTCYKLTYHQYDKMRFCVTD